ncbi:LytR/AlgR family response regulator transcription factor [Clostridium felsineum]|uniref:LytR/AlgR family response regulator transcription factor n=1 Tax=Clostridium felsineum TaxID=36839 RepID=UPI00098C6C15
MLLYSVILVEDNAEQRHKIKNIIVSIYQFVKIYEADCEAEALKIIENNDVNIFLLDIMLKESSGLNLAMKIRKIKKYQFSQIIFLTHHMEYIIQAFKKVHCYDYILKPYNEKIVKAILSKLMFHENNVIKERTNKEIIIMPQNGTYVNIKVDDIFFIEVKGKKCELNTIKGTYTVNNMSLKKLLQSIDCEYIIRSHKAFAVNKNYIRKIEKIDVKLSNVYFHKCCKVALLGYKFKDNVISEFKKGKVIL